jgi:hypothetical protein
MKGKTTLYLLFYLTANSFPHSFLNLIIALASSVLER